MKNAYYRLLKLIIYSLHLTILKNRNFDKAKLRDELNRDTTRFPHQITMIRLLSTA